jgi:hypothetical protein
VFHSCRKGDALGQAGKPFSTCTRVVTNLFPLRRLTNRQHPNSLAIRPPSAVISCRGNSKIRISNSKWPYTCQALTALPNSCSNNFATICNCSVSRLLLLLLPFTTSDSRTRLRYHYILLSYLSLSLVVSSLSRERSLADPTVAVLVP